MQKHAIIIGLIAETVACAAGTRDVRVHIYVNGFLCSSRGIGVACQAHGAAFQVEGIHRGQGGKRERAAGINTSGAANVAGDIHGIAVSYLAGVAATRGDASRPDGSIAPVAAPDGGVGRGRHLAGEHEQDRHQSNTYPQHLSLTSHSSSS